MARCAASALRALSMHVDIFEVNGHHEAIGREAEESSHHRGLMRVFYNTILKEFRAHDGRKLDNNE